VINRVAGSYGRWPKNSLLVLVMLVLVVLAQFVVGVLQVVMDAVKRLKHIYVAIFVVVRTVLVFVDLLFDLNQGRFHLQLQSV
jgi:hypothetical protein